MKIYPHTGQKEQAITPEFWAARYVAKDTDWDRGAPSPGLVDYLATRPVPPGKVLVPGCGRGHDVRFLARNGFHVTGLDVAPIAVHDARQLAAAESLPHARFEQQDFFNLTDPLRGPYDGMFEHTFFCAIDPDLRDRYVAVAAAVIRPGGWLLGVFYNIQPESGPPFGTTRDELIERFSPSFDLQYETVPRSYEGRTGKELLMHWQRKES